MKQIKLCILLFALLLTVSCGKNAEPGPTGQTDERLETPAAQTDEKTEPAPVDQTDEGFDIDISRIDGSTATIPLTQAGLTALLGSYDGLVHNKTDRAYELLCEGEKDVIFVTYPSEEEFAMAKERGIELEIVPIVKDALVFLTNAQNSVTDISSGQIQDIYSGKITNWKSLGGPDAEIIPYQRPVNSGSQTLFLKLAMDGVTPVDAPDTFKPAGMDNLVDAVASYDNGRNSLGFSVFYYATAMYLRDSAKLIAIDGVMPTTQTIAGGEYKYLTYYYAVFDKNLPGDAPSRKLVDWFLSEEGQKTALSAGYVPLAPVAGEQDNIIYGYHGSTPENTTQSSGTGGKEFVGIQNNAITYNNMVWKQDEDTKRLIDFNLPGYPEVSKAVGEWFMNVYPDAQKVSCDVNFFGDLICVSARLFTEGLDYIVWPQEYAVFDAKTGKQLALSDLFYDGVNYIDYINKNLLIEAYPSAPIDGPDLWASFDEKCVLRPFTGIPADYDKFRVFLYDGCVGLQIFFDYDNPFFAMDYYFLTPSVFLPADLSPYAGIWKVTYSEMRPIPQVKAAVPQIVSNYLTPSEKDDKINAAIMRAYEQAAQTDAFTDYTERIGIGANPDANVIWAVETDFWDGNITVAFSYIPYSRMESINGGIVSMVTLDLATGEEIDTDYLRGTLPEDWWKTLGYGHFNKYGWYLEDDYAPPDGSELKYFRKRNYGGLVFCVLQPDGEIITVYCYDYIL